MRRTLLLILLATLVLVGILLPLGLRVTPVSWLVAYAQLGCWGSICQDRAGRVYLSGSVTTTTPIAISTAPGAITFPGDLTLACTRNPVIGPGALAGTVRLRPGSIPGTMNLTIIVGASQTETIVVSNIPGGTC